jgi:transcriptional regulator with XRE-family HTH domain
MPGMEFKDWLTKQLKHKGWSVNELARRIHMNPSNFRKLIHGGYIKEPTQHLKRISIALGLPDDAALQAYRGNPSEVVEGVFAPSAHEQLEHLVSALFQHIPDEMLMNFYRDEAQKRGLI